MSTEHLVVPAKADAEKTKVFISYSRKDLDFTNRLASMLTERDFIVLIDREDIMPGEPWQERITGLIDQADTVAFVISPDSTASDVCQWEVDLVAEKNKRMAPLQHVTGVVRTCR